MGPVACGGIRPVGCTSVLPAAPHLAPGRGVPSPSLCPTVPSCRAYEALGELSLLACSAQEEALLRHRLATRRGDGPAETFALDHCDLGPALCVLSVLRGREGSKGGQGRVVSALDALQWQPQRDEDAERVWEAPTGVTCMLLWGRSDADAVAVPSRRSHHCCAARAHHHAPRRPHVEAELVRMVRERQTLKLGLDVVELDTWGLDMYTRRNVFDGACGPSF